jgi:type IV pilus assembly protein PilM
MFFRKKQSLVGLDIGSYSVKVVEIESLPGGGHRLVNYGISEPLSEAIVDGEIMDRQLVTDAIANLLEARGVKTRNVVAAVSGRAVIVKKIAMNKLSAEDAQQAIVWEAEQHVPYDINDVSLDFEILGDNPQDDKQMQVLLVAAKKDMVLTFADLIRESGLQPVVIDVDSFAIQNALAANYAPLDRWCDPGVGPRSTSTWCRTASRTSRRSCSSAATRSSTRSRAAATSRRSRRSRRCAATTRRST